MEQVRHWWNGQWPTPHGGESRRRDIWQYQTRVAAVDRDGQRWWQLLSERRAMELVFALQQDQAGWREVMPRLVRDD